MEYTPINALTTEQLERVLKSIAEGFPETLVSIIMRTSPVVGYVVVDQFCGGTGRVSEEVQQILKPAPTPAPVVVAAIPMAIYPVPTLTPMSTPVSIPVSSASQVPVRVQIPFLGPSTPSSSTKRPRDVDDESLSDINSQVPPAKKFHAESLDDIETLKLSPEQQTACVLYAFMCQGGQTTITTIASRIGLSNEQTDSIVKSCINDKLVETTVKEGGMRRVTYYGLASFIAKDAYIGKSLCDKIGNPVVCRKILSRFYVQFKHLIKTKSVTI